MQVLRINGEQQQIHDTKAVLSNLDFREERMVSVVLQTETLARDPFGLQCPLAWTDTQDSATSLCRPSNHPG